MKQYDFSGWATRNNLRCSDGCTIMKDAFKHDDGHTVPLVWNHRHNEPFDVLGHAVLENRDEGVYAYCKLNNTESGKTAKLLIEHGDVSALSIYANQLKQNGGNVLHGAIREVSLVLAGANPGAFIDSILTHGETSEEEAVIYTGEEISICHADEEKSEEAEESPQTDKKTQQEEKPKMAKEQTNKAKSEDEETIADVFNTLTEKQKTVVYALIGQALKDATNNNDEEEKETVKHNVFESNEGNGMDYLTHSEMEAIISDGKKYGSLKESMLAHGIENVDYLFPDVQALDKTPQFITRNLDWVEKIMDSVHHTPFSRIKSVFADLTEDDARAKGYVKANQKAEKVFKLLKRTTTPTTVYKKQKLERDDVVDITDFDVVAWLKTEMRLMLDEEIARAILIGDGRSSYSDDKIDESSIRPIYSDADLFIIKAEVTYDTDATDDTKAKAFEYAAVKARKDYRGTGNPTLFTTEEQLTNLLLREDTLGRKIYTSVNELATALRIKEIVTVEAMKNATRTDSDSGTTYQVLGIIVNPSDYNVGADKGGAVNMFDDFDIDYNAQKYLIETRCSGALTKPYSAIALEVEAEDTEAAG
ncbi:MAG: HK97 family phage prohead protease [Ruminococcus sp.]|nr:HK97 family phage prohead protease [Ruminococcus sp.]